MLKIILLKWLHPKPTDVCLRNTPIIYHVSFQVSGFSTTTNLLFKIFNDITPQKSEQRDNTSTFTWFRSMRMLIEWLSSTSPDLPFGNSRMVHIRILKFTNNALVSVLSLLITRKVALEPFTDSKCLFDVIKIQSWPSENIWWWM